MTSRNEKLNATFRELSSSSVGGSHIHDWTNERVCILEFRIVIKMSSLKEDRSGDVKLRIYKEALPISFPVAKMKTNHEINCLVSVHSSE